MRRSGIGSWAGCAGLVMLVLGGCTTNPATGRSILSTLSLSEEVALGAQASPEFMKEYGGPVPDAQLQGYVTNIGRAMAAQTEGDYPRVPWEFTLVNSDVVNAFALPGGKVFVTRGLAKKLSNEAQLAGVIGHEIGHVSAQHGNQRISQQTLFNIGMTVAAVVVSQSDNERVRQAGAVGIPALQIGGNLVLLSYGREEELEADRLGVRYMSKVGYDPMGQLGVMQVLASLGGGQRQPEMLATHPDPQKRIEQIRALLAGEYAHTQNSPQFQLKEQEFRTQFLSRLAGLGPAPDAQRVTARELERELGRRVLWCAHCREERVAGR